MNVKRTFSDFCSRNCDIENELFLKKLIIEDFNAFHLSDCSSPKSQKLVKNKYLHKKSMTPSTSEDSTVSDEKGY